jgi:methyl-accepting chemotaxis protein
VGEIAAASQEQSRGIGEINGAVSQMDKVTQRVTANAEELSSASEEMSGQASSLRDMVRRLVRMVEGSSADVQSALPQAAPKAAYQAPVFKALRPANGNGGHNKPLSLGRNSEHDAVLPMGLAELRTF